MEEGTPTSERAAVKVDTRNIASMSPYRFVPHPHQLFVNLSSSASSSPATVEGLATEEKNEDGKRKEEFLAQVLEFEVDRLDYVGYMLRDLALSIHFERQNTEAVSTDHKKVFVPLDLAKDRIAAAREAAEAAARVSSWVTAAKKGGTSQAAPAIGDELLLQLRFASLWRFNYEEWYERMAGVRVKDSEGKEYDPLPSGVRFVALTAANVGLLLHLSKQKLWYTKPWNDEERRAHDELCRSLNEEIARSGEPPVDGFFMRLSTRSPKDVPKLRSVKTGIEIVDLLVRSERILLDLGFFYKFYYRAKYLQVVLMPWVQMPKGREFRCFVHRKRMTAISQYEWDTTFDELQDGRTLHAMRDAIHQFHLQTAPFAPYSSYIIDVYLINEPTTQAMRVHLIEFNPFFGDLTSGSCLFEWQQDFDLLHGKSGSPADPPLLRVRKKTDSTQIVFLDV